MSPLASGLPLAYRRLAGAERIDVQRRIRHIERQAHETVTQEIHRRVSTAQQDAVQAVLAPHVVRMLTDKVFRAIEKRFVVERYRRGY